MHGIADTEAEHDIGRRVWCYGSHLTSYVHLGVSGQNCVFLNESLEVNTISVKANLNEGELRESGTLLSLSRPWVNPERNLRV
jgi:hypothetical protein